MTKQLLIRDTPPGMKHQLQAMATEQQANLQAVAVGILAKEFKTPFEPGRGPANAPDLDNPTLPLRMPAELHRRLRVASAEQGLAHADLALLVLGKHLNIPIEPERLNRRRGRKAVA